MNAKFAQAVKENQEHFDAISPSPTNKSWRVYQTAILAIDTFRPGNTNINIPYVLGIQAGIELDTYDMAPVGPFKEGTVAAKQFAAGIKDALAISQLKQGHNNAVLGSFVNDVIGSVFEGAK